MEYSAIVHYMEKRYCYAVEKGKFIIRIETKKDDMQRVILHYRDKYIPVEVLDTSKSVEMKRTASDRFKDYYEALIEIDCRCLRYQFELVDTQGQTSFFGNYEFFDEKITHNDWLFDLPQTLREEELMDIPQWANNKVVYQIFPSRFATTESVPKDEWYKAPIGPRDNLKGNLRGIINRLGHIKQLGIDVIYMTPVFRSDSTHKYDTIDYYKIDPSFGDESDLKELVDKAHDMGMRVILDAVFNHTSPKFFAFQDIVDKELESEYIDWYYIESFPLKSGFKQEKPNYKTFAYHGGMPKLNLQNEAVADYFINVAKYWIEKCDIDGWRLDVGDEVSHYFWKKFRRAIKAVKPEALIIGEIWHYAGDFLEGDEWDTVMNYPFYLAVQDFVANKSITASQFAGRLGLLEGRLYRQIIPVLLNLIDSHDTARFMHVAGNSRDKLKLAAAMQLLSPGMPMIYYGDEFGMTGGNDPDCRRGMVWDEDYQDKDMFVWYSKLTSIRKEVPALLEGELAECVTDDENAIIKMVRELQGKRVTVVFHAGDKDVCFEEYNGCVDRLTGKIYDGNLRAYHVLLFEQ